MKPLEKTRLIINGDDFGMSKEVNEAVIRAFKGGVLTSCSLMVSGDAFEHAVRLGRENEGLAIGLHIVTVQDRSLLPHTEIPAIVDRERRFAADPVTAGFAYYFSKESRRQLEQELKAQFERFVSTGFELSHIDSHLHMHVHPVIFNSLVRLGVQYGVKRMRVPEDDLGLYFSSGGQRRLKPMVDHSIFKVLCRKMKERLRAQGFAFARKVYGFFMSGRMSEDYVLRVFDHLGPGTSELYLHPAAFDGKQGLMPHERQCMRELDILLSTRIRGRLMELGIDLTTYGELRGET